MVQQFDYVLEAVKDIGKESGFLKRNLFLAYTGWNYDFYDIGNKLCENDGIIRNTIAASLGRASKKLNQTAAFVAKTIPEPSRKNPFPGEDERREIDKLRSLANEIDGFSTRILNLPVIARSYVLGRGGSSDALKKLVGFDMYLAQIIENLAEAAIKFSETQEDAYSEEARRLQSDAEQILLERQQYLFDLQSNRV